MFTFARTAFVALALSLGGLSAASAATLGLTASWDLTTASGPDTLGLSGASVLMTTNFADGTVFTRDGFDVPRAVASSVSFLVSGASVASTNGIYAATSALGLFATGNQFDGFLTSASGTNPFVPDADATFFRIADLVNQVRIDSGGTVGSALLGDPLTFERLKGVKVGVGSVLVFAQSGGTNYSMSNFVTVATGDVAPVPLPAGLPLLAGALALLAAVRRRSVLTR